MSRACPKCGTSFSDDVFFCGYDGTITIQERSAENFDPRLGNQLGDYVIVAHVADGAMGRVYEGRHAKSKARVAIKVLHADVAKDPVSVERFRQEFETASSLDHPYIVKVIEFGDTADGSYFMTMEYLDGEELSEILRREGSQAPSQALRILCQLAEGLDCAHAEGVVHRDMKPDNIFVCPSDDGDILRILDFGSVKLQMSTGSKLTAMGTTLGSPFYMSPEQAMGRLDVDQRTDVFAISAIMHEMATGQVAFDGASIADILTKIVQYDPPPVHPDNPAYPPTYDVVIQRGIRKDKTQRHASMRELAAAALNAFGLQGEAAQWCDRPTAEIQAALDSSDAPNVWLPEERESELPTLASMSSGRPPLLWMLVGLALIAGCAVLYFS